MSGMFFLFGLARLDFFVRGEFDASLSVLNFLPRDSRQFLHK